MAIEAGSFQTSKYRRLTSGERTLVELVEAAGVVDGAVVLDFHRAERIMEDGMETPSGSRVRRPRPSTARLAVVADQGSGIVGADRQIEEAIDWIGRFGDIELDDT